MQRIVLAASISALMVICSVARADVFTLSPSVPDLDDLDHYKYYTWGVSTPWPTGEQEAVSATLSFNDIYNWTTESNVLYIHLLDSASDGINSGYDNPGDGDYFDGQGIVLVVYQDLSSAPQDLIYQFTQDQIATLNTYAADGSFGLGIDPDCHYYNSSVQLHLTTIPEPCTVGLLAVGAIALLFRRRARHA